MGKFNQLFSLDFFLKPTFFEVADLSPVFDNIFDNIFAVDANTF